MGTMIAAGGIELARSIKAKPFQIVNRIAGCRIAEDAYFSDCGGGRVEDDQLAMRTFDIHWCIQQTRSRIKGQIVNILRRFAIDQNGGDDYIVLARPKRVGHIRAGLAVNL